MLAAYRAGAAAGGVGQGSSPISHLSGTMSALLEASPARLLSFHLQDSEEEEFGRRGD